MKKFIYISALSLSLVGLMSSCDLDSPTKSDLDSQTVFSTYDLAEKAVMAIHQSFGETNSYRGRFLPYYGLNTDIEHINGDDNTKGDDKYLLCRYETAANNSQMNTDNNAYAKFFEAVERANQGIVGLRSYGNVESNSDMAQLLGELLTLRAVVYLDLLKGWGDVPARFEPITTETMYQERSDRDVIYKQLLADLLEAEDYCAWPNETTVTSTTERVSKAFVKALRARIALYAGGYALRQDGTVRLSNDPELAQSTMYEIAKKECVDIINKGCCKLGSFKDNFYRLSTDDVTAGLESIWEIPFSEGRGRVMYTFGIKHQAKDQYTQQAQGGVNGPMPTLFYDYDVDDVRRDITCAPYRWSNEAKSKQELWAIHSWCFGKLRYEWTHDVRTVTSTNDDGVNWQYMRLADVYLMAAEAVNEIDGPAQAWQYMKPVLDRALPAAKVTALQSQYTASKSAFFDGVVDQRKFELAGEMLRKADLIRWNLLKSKLDEAKADMLALSNREGKYADIPKNLYFTYESDGETLKVYGLNHGETDEQGEKLINEEGYEKKSWSTELTGYAASIYTAANPDKRQYWPIWQTFIDNSNNMLNNDWLN
jgi:hypothetical protein